MRAMGGSVENLDGGGPHRDEGVVFGGITLFLMMPLATTALVLRGLNEVLFPA